MNGLQKLRAALLTLVLGCGVLAHSALVQAAVSASVSPTLLAFGNQQIGTVSAAKSVTLTNIGMGSLNFINATITGVHLHNFAQSNNCPAVLAAGGTCTINVTFTPSASGNRTGVLRLNDNAGFQDISLTGTGVAPSASVTPTSLAFNPTQVGVASASQSVVLTNTGVGPLSFNSATITAGNYLNFAQTHTCPAVLDAPTVVGGVSSCTINVTFKPNAAGNRVSALSISDAAGVQSVALNGTGFVYTASVSPAALTFADQQVGTASAAQAVVLSNTSDRPMPVNSISITAGNYLNFTQTHTCPAVLDAPTVVGGISSCTINVTFKPNAAGNRVSALSISDAAGVQTVALNGTGFVYTASVSPAALSFAEQQVGTASAAQAVVLSNTGDRPMPINSIAITTGNYLNFTQTHTCPAVLDAPTVVGGTSSCTIDVTFKPNAAGSRVSALRISDAAGVQSVALSGAGVAPSASVSPSTPLVFDPTQVGVASASQSVVFANTGVGPLKFNSATTPGVNGTNFSPSHDCPAALPKDGFCTIKVTFTPSAVGNRVATLRVSSAAGFKDVPLSGTGFVPPTVKLTSPLANATMNAPANFTLTATATAPNSSVTQVEFYADNLLIHTDTTAPYTYQWNNVLPGAHSLVAIVTNALGKTAMSSAVNVTVTATTLQTYYIHTDHLDTPRVITDTAGNKVWEWQNSDPFGNNIPNENPSGLGAFPHNLGFAGQYRDRETNTFYNFYRDHYFSDLGRYGQSDPIGLRGGINTYTYVGGNPLKYVDPFGLDYIIVTGGSSGTASYYDNNGSVVVQMPYRSGYGANKNDSTVNGQGRTPPGTYNIEHPPTTVPASQPNQASFCDTSGNCWWTPYVPQFPTPNNRCLPASQGGTGQCGMHPDGGPSGTAGCTGLTSVNTDAFKQAIKNYAPSSSNPLPVYVQ